jgi:APA family basic amino acid/polyamine antiporter
MSHNKNQESALERAIGGFGFGVINLNSVIGAGIFGLPAAAAAMSGAFSPWLFVLSGLLVLTVVLSFAEAASMFQKTGGALAYASHAFGPFVGFQTGWLAYLSRVAAMGANTNLLVTYASWFWAPLDTEPWHSGTLVAIFGLLTWLNVVGVRNSVALLYAFTVLKLLPLSLLILFGLGKIDLGTLMGANTPNIGELGEGILLVLYAYVGFEGTVVTAGEGRNPRRDLPRALINTILIIAVIYVLVQLVAMGVMPNLAASDKALADVAAIMFGPAGAVLLTLGAVFSIGGNLHSSLLSAPRMTFALGRDGSLPSVFARVHPRYHTPHVSIWVYGALCLGMALTGTFVWLAVISTLVRLLTYMVCIAALPRLHRTIEPHDHQFRLPGGLLIPGIAMLLCLWLITHASLNSWLMTGLFFLVGTALYFVSAHKPVTAVETDVD